MLWEVVKYLDDNTTLTQGTNLFGGRIPAAVSAISVVVMEQDPGYRDPQPGQTDRGLTPLRILIQGSDRSSYDEARTVAQTVFNALHGRVQISLPIVRSGPEYLVNIRCADPVSAGLDDRGRDLVVIYCWVARQEL